MNYSSVLSSIFLWWYHQRDKYILENVDDQVENNKIDCYSKLYKEDL